MMYFIARLGSKKRVIKILGLLSVYAILITVLRCYDTITYNADLQRAGAVFCLDTRVDLWVANELVFGATPSYQGADLVGLLDGEGVLLVFFPIIIGILGLQMYADDLRGGLMPLLFTRMEKKKYYMINGMGYVVFIIIVTCFFLCIQLLSAVVGAFFISGCGIIVSQEPVAWHEVFGSIARWCILNASFALLSYTIVLFFGKLRIIAQLVYITICFSAEVIGLGLFHCGPLDMACINSGLNYPSMKVYWLFVLLSLVVSGLLGLVRGACSMIGPEGLTNEALL